MLNHDEKGAKTSPKASLHKGQSANIPRIIQMNEPILREIAQPVRIEDIKSQRVRDVILGMKLALAKEEDGAAIAAPQINVPLRIFVVSGKILSHIDPNSKAEEDMVFINPEIIRASRDKTEFEEGCLSVRWLYGNIKRSSKVTIRAYDENANKIERGASGLMAQIFQHEIDHLDGILFIDNAYNVIDMPPEEDGKKTR